MAISSSLVKVGVFRSEGDGYQPPGEEVFSINHISIYFQIYFPYISKYIFKYIFHLPPFLLASCFQSVVTRWASRSCARRGKPTFSSPSPRWTGLSFKNWLLSEFQWLSSEDFWDAQDVACFGPKYQTQEWSILAQNYFEVFWSKMWSIAYFFSLHCLRRFIQ